MVDYLRTARHSYMIVKNARTEYEEYELQMVLHNEVSSLLPLQVMENDGAKEYWYDVTGLKSMERQIQFKAVDSEDLRFLLNSICDMKLQMEEYLLDDANIDFAPDRIFLDPAGKQLRFCYIPGYGRTAKNGIRSLMEEIIGHLDHGDEWAVKVGYGIYEDCAALEFTTEMCQARMRQGDKQEEKSLPKSDHGEKSDLQPDIPKLQQDIPKLQPDISDLRPDIPAPERIPLLPDEAPGQGWQTKKSRRQRHKNPRVREHRRRGNPGKRRWETEPGRDGDAKEQKPYEYLPLPEEEKRRVPEDDTRWEQTVCFSDAKMKNMWELQYRGDGLEQDQTMESFPYVIGKDSAKVTGVLQAETVSRIHARISQSDGKLFVEDFNSTNGTYINGTLLPMNTPRELKEGDHIIFATEEFVLRRNLRFAGR